MDKDLLNEALKGLLETASETKDFVLSEMPDVLRQLLVYHGWKYFLWFVICLIVVVVSSRWGKRLSKKIEEDEEEVFILGYVVSFFLLYGFLIAATVNFFQLMKVILAPKIFLIEFIVDLI